MMSRFVLFLLLAVPVFAGERIKVVTYNIHFGSGVRSPSVPKIKIWNPFGKDPEFGGQQLPLSRGTTELDAIAESLKRLGPDVVILNEVLASCAQSRFIDQGQRIAEKTGWNLAYFRASVGPLGGHLNGGGNAILSRHPIVEKGGRIVGDADERGVTTARVMVPGIEGGLAVGATHVSYKTENGMRTKQVTDLATEMLAKPGAVLIGGDFNEAPGGADTKMLQERFATAGRALSGAYETAPDGPGESFPATGPRERIDYLFTTGPLVPKKCWVAHEVLHSDHLPVVAEYDVTTEVPVADPGSPLALLGVDAR